jgi:hypothetical protein
VSGTGETPIGTWYAKGDPQIFNIKIWEFNEDGRFVGIASEDKGCLVVDGQWEIRRENIWIGLEPEPNSKSFEGAFSVRGQEMEIIGLKSSDREVLKKSDFSVWVTSSNLALCGPE